MTAIPLKKMTSNWLKILWPKRTQWVMPRMNSEFKRMQRIWSEKYLMMRAMLKTSKPQEWLLKLWCSKLIANAGRRKSSRQSSSERRSKKRRKTCWARRMITQKIKTKILAGKEHNFPRIRSLSHLKKTTLFTWRRRKKLRICLRTKTWLKKREKHWKNRRTRKLLRTAQKKWSPKRTKLSLKQWLHKN